jgi:hypothetical protein
MIIIILFDLVVRVVDVVRVVKVKNLPRQVAANLYNPYNY